MGATEKHMLPVTFATDNAVLHVSTPTVNVEQTSGLFAPVLGSDEVPDHVGQIGGTDRLAEVHLEAGLQSAHAIFNPAIGRERYRRGVEIALSLPLANATHQAVAVFTRHIYVGHHHIGPLPGRRCTDQIIGCARGTWRHTVLA